MLHQGRDDRARADCFIASALRAADENLVAARCVVCAARIVGSFNDYLAYMRIEQKSRDLAWRVHGSHEGLVQLGAGHIVGRNERYTDRVKARPECNTGTPAAVATRVRDFLVPIE